ncbi:acidic leucine-rich nuclear phosphoprotein 32 family member E [Melia azedarach]|uniref:Acidic leucine-rich nuclear phosphoprotein 32 family member E n=1 Tax=Melia azedarach TaxID=155640 RepID=A0ACC1XIE0_MELAZ|nr:acidic leucine-rich nuclear phosphoprotein 32 family member E [Melia azedarach]
MEPSKFFGCKEECSSSVSGWTMYLGSPGNENDNYDDDDDDDRNTYQQGDAFKLDYHLHDDDDANDKSDDSMASDASSGPSHQELPIPWGNSKPSLDKHETSKYSWKQNLQKQKTKRDESRIKVERDEQPVLITKSTTSQALSGAKARKSKQMGK